MASFVTSLRHVAAPRVAMKTTAPARTFFNSSVSRSMMRRPMEPTFFSPKAPCPSSHTQYFSSNTRNRFFNSRFNHSRFFHSSRAHRTADAAKSQSLSQRLKTLSREYGWSALGVYLLLSALDFPFCYLLVRTLGTDRIGEWEHAVTSHVAPLIPQSVKDAWYSGKAWFRRQEVKLTGDDDVSDAVDMAGWGLTEAEQAKKKESEGGREASLATQLALAYAIHKSFIFVRVPLTAMVTPKVVKVLRGWGWDIGKRTTKAAKALKREEHAAKVIAKSNAKSKKN